MTVGEYIRDVLEPRVAAMEKQIALIASRLGMDKLPEADEWEKERAAIRKETDSPQGRAIVDAAVGKLPWKRDGKSAAAGDV